VPCIVWGWKSHWYLYVPAFVNVKEKVILELMGVLSPELKVLLASRLVTVWGVWVVFFQVTVVPTLMVSVPGLKTKLPLLSVVIVTAWVGPVTALVGVGVVLPPP
jgi:hypothetical protein